MLELLYLSVAVMTVYVGLMYLRRAGPAQRTYAWLLLIDGAVAAAAYGAAKLEAPEAIADLAGAISLFGFVGLVLLPPILRFLTRRAIAHDHDGLALWLTGIREVLTPGLGARQEREMIHASRAIRAGEAETVLAALRQRRAATGDRRERQIIDDRLVLVLLAAARWREAIDTFEDRSDDVIRPGQVPIFVEVIHAHGEIGDLGGAARLLAFLERLPGAEEPVLAPQIARARLLFLAFAGRVQAVEALLALRKQSLSPDARAYWLGIARLHGGDAEGARASLTEAVRRSSDRRRRAAAEERLVSVRAAAEPRELSQELSAFADEVSARALAAVADAPPILEGLHISATPVTLAIIAANIAVFAVVAIVFGTSTDAFVLARAGANLRVAVASGEWWRLISCTFLHAGALHIAVNMFSLFSLGRVVEQIVGSLRFGAIYALAAVGGSLASYWFSAGLSVGASGAVFGILGAAIVEVALRRSKGRSAWRSSLLSSLIFIAAVNLAIGYTQPIIDQSAHVGGFLAGAIATFLVSQRHRLGQGAAGRVLAILVCGAAVAATVLTGWRVVVTSYARTVDRVGWRQVTIEGVRLEVPRQWEPTEKGEALAEPMFGVRTLVVARRDAADLGAIMSGLRADRQADTDVKSLAPVATVIAAPDGWTARALRLVATIDGEERNYVESVFLRPVAGHTLVLDTLVPELAEAEARPVIGRIVISARPVP